MKRGMLKYILYGFVFAICSVVFAQTPTIISPQSGSLTAGKVYEFSSDTKDQGRNANWSFGDGSSAGGSIISKIFTAGTYNITFTYEYASNGKCKKNGWAVDPDTGESVWGCIEYEQIWHSCQTTRTFVVYSPPSAGLSPSSQIITNGKKATITPIFSGGNGIITPGNIIVTSGVAGYYTLDVSTPYTLTVTNPAGDCATASVSVKVIPAARIQSFSATGPVTSGSPSFLTAEFSGGKATVENLEGSWSVSPATWKVYPTIATSSYRLRVRNDVGDEDTKEVSVAVLPAPSEPFITTPEYVTANSYSNASVPVQAGCRYTWSISGGKIPGDSNGNQITFLAGASGRVDLSCKVTNQAGTDSSVGIAGSRIVAAFARPFITAPQFVTANAISNASVLEQSGCGYKWSISGGAISEGLGTNQIAFLAGGSEAVKLCCTLTNQAGTDSELGSADCTIVPKAAIPVIDAPKYVTANNYSNASVSVQAGCRYTWRISGGTISGGDGTNQVTFLTGASGPVNLSCTVTNQAGTESSAKPVSSSIVPVSTKPFITAPRFVTANVISNASVLEQPGCSYKWSMSGGAIFEGLGTNQIAFLAGASETVKLSCTVTNQAGTDSEPGSVDCTIVPKATMPVIDAPMYVTGGHGGYLAKVPPESGCSYIWSIDGGSITAGSSTSQITFSAGPSGLVDLRYKATNAAGTTSNSDKATCTIVSMPAIQGFQASKPKATIGTSGTLNLTFSGGTATIDGIEGNWPLSPASVPVIIRQSLSYTLRIRNMAGDEVTAETSVEGVPAAVILSFDATKPTVSAGEGTSLVGFFKNGNGNISNGLGIVGNGESKFTTPNGKTTYTLTVVNDAGDSVTKQAIVDVVDMPFIDDFTVSQSKIRPGGSVQLFARFSGGTGAIVPLVTTDGSLNSGQSVSVHPSETTDYVLTVTNAAGAAVSQTMHLTVGLTRRWVKDIVYMGSKEIAEFDATGMHLTLTDHLGSPRILVDQNGKFAEQRFTPFGEQLAGTDAAGKFAKGFTNHEQTDASGMIYMQARFYLPMWGRFASPDPARDQHFEETQSWNIYSYVQNNPTMHFDPNGMETQVAIGGRLKDNAFGHSAIIINGKVYSYGTNNTHGSRNQKDWGADAGKYLAGETQKGRETKLLTLNITSEKEQELQQYYESHNPNAPGAPGYTTTSNNCVTTVNDGLDATNITPTIKPAEVSPLVAALNPAAAIPAPKPVTPGALESKLKTSGVVKKEETVGESKTGFWASVIGTLKHLF